MVEVVAVGLLSIRYLFVAIAVALKTTSLERLCVQLSSSYPPPFPLPRVLIPAALLLWIQSSLGPLLFLQHYWVSFA